MEPFNSMTDASDFFRLAWLRAGGGDGGPKSCLVRFRGGIRRVSFLGGAVYYGEFVSGLIPEEVTA